ncbi:MAG: 30S ribosomal protein S20 [Patescibacteria group bacterium]
MPNKKSAVKALKQSLKKQARNTTKKLRIKNLRKKLEVSITKGAKDEAIKLLTEMYQALDKAAKKNTIHKNAAARKKSRLTKKVNNIK